MSIGFYRNNDTRYELQDGDEFHWSPLHGIVELKPVTKEPLRVRAGDEVMTASVLAYRVDSFGLFWSLLSAVCLTNGLWPHMSQNDTVCTLRTSKPKGVSMCDVEQLTTGIRRF